MPEGRPFDFSKELFPLLLEMGPPALRLHRRRLPAGHRQPSTSSGRRTSTRSTRRGRAERRGIKLRGKLWVGEAWSPPPESVEGPAFIGNYCRIAPQASVGLYGPSLSVTLREHARMTRSVVDSSTYLGRRRVGGAIVGSPATSGRTPACDEGVAVGDSCTIGEQSVVMPGVRIYRSRRGVEAGALVDRNLIWESRLASRLRPRRGLGPRERRPDPETALRVGIALGTALKRGVRVVTSRDRAPASRLLKRAVVSGITSTGVEVADLHVMPAAVNRHFLKSERPRRGACTCVRAPSTPRSCRSTSSSRRDPGDARVPQGDRSEALPAAEFRRAAYDEVAQISTPTRAAETYADDLLRTLDVEGIKARGFRIVVDYAHSAASIVLPVVLGPLGVETIAAHPYGGEQAAESTDGVREALGHAKRLVSAVGADFGVVFDRSGERIYLVDEQAHEVPVEQELLLFLSLLASDGKSGTLALPITVTSLAEPLVKGSKLEVTRTPASLSALTRASADNGVVFAGSIGGGFVFPEFLPAYDGREPLQPAPAPRSGRPPAL